MADEQRNGYTLGRLLWNSWGKTLTVVITVVFSFAAAYFKLQNRVSAVENEQQNIHEDVSDIKIDVRWIRDNWNQK